MNEIWHPFPHDHGPYDYAGAGLKRHWERLHRGDREPFPDQAWVERLADGRQALGPKAKAKDAARILQEGWRAYHAGDFGQAVRLGLDIGPLGYNLANKATNIYATYLEKDDASKLKLFQQAAERAQKITELAPELANGWYFGAQALGRYSQGITIAKALALGLGSKVKSRLETAIRLEPSHADAHIALGAYHAEVIGKVGSLIGGLTYGADRNEAQDHFLTALDLNPGSAIARIEFANGLLKLFGRAKSERIIALYREAAACEPLDAMERLDVELARSELED